MNEQNNLSDNVSEKPEYNDKPKRTKGKRIWPWVLGSVCGFIAILVVLVLILVEVGRFNLLNHDDVDLQIDENASDIEIEDDNTVVYQSKKYVYNKNVLSVLCIGVDKYKLSDNRRGSGQADALFLATLDTKTGRTCIIPIPRDSMVEIDFYSEKGEHLGIKRSQICLSYGYGDGKKSSCENTVKSVSRMFYGLPIESYIAIDMDAIEVLTEKVGGVEVVIPDDIKLNKKWYKKGQKVNVSGKEALFFLMSRENDLEASLERMSRQKQFVSKFASKVIEKTKKDITTPVGIFNSIKPYIVTNLDVADVSFLTSCFMNGTAGMRLEYKNILGEATQPGEYVEYIYDIQSVYDIIIDVFYVPKN